MRGGPVGVRHQERSIEISIEISIDNRDIEIPAQASLAVLRLKRMRLMTNERKIRKEEKQSKVIPHTLLRECHVLLLFGTLGVLFGVEAKHIEETLVDE